MKGIGRNISIGMLGMLLGVGGFWAISPLAQLTAQAQDLTPEQRASLQAQYDQLQKEIAQYQKIIDDTKTKEKSIQGDVTVEFPMYTRNYVQEGGAIQLGKSDQKDEEKTEARP